LPSPPSSSPREENEEAAAAAVLKKEEEEEKEVLHKSPSLPKEDKPGLMTVGVQTGITPRLGVGHDRDELLDLYYDPFLSCYYDPVTNKYYQLK